MSELLRNREQDGGARAEKIKAILGHSFADFWQVEKKLGLPEGSLWGRLDEMSDDEVANVAGAFEALGSDDADTDAANGAGDLGPDAKGPGPNDEGLGSGDAEDVSRSKLLAFILEQPRERWQKEAGVKEWHEVEAMPLKDLAILARRLLESDENGDDNGPSGDSSMATSGRAESGREALRRSRLQKIGLGVMAAVIALGIAVGVHANKIDAGGGAGENVGDSENTSATGELGEAFVLDQSGYVGLEGSGLFAVQLEDGSVISNPEKSNPVAYGESLASAVAEGRAIDSMSLDEIYSKGYDANSFYNVWLNGNDGSGADGTFFMPASEAKLMDQLSDAQWQDLAEYGFSKTDLNDLKSLENKIEAAGPELRNLLGGMIKANLGTPELATVDGKYYTSQIVGFYDGDKLVSTNLAEQEGSGRRVVLRFENTISGETVDIAVSCGGQRLFTTPDGTPIIQETEDSEEIIETVDPTDPVKPVKPVKPIIKPVKPVKPIDPGHPEDDTESEEDEDTDEEETPEEEVPEEEVPEEEVPEVPFDGKGDNPHASDPDLGPDDNGGGKHQYDDNLEGGEDAPLIDQDEAEHANDDNLGYVGTGGDSTSSSGTGAQLPGSASDSAPVNPGTTGGGGGGESTSTTPSTPPSESAGNLNGTPNDFSAGLSTDAEGNAAQENANNAGGGTTHSDSEQESIVAGNNF